MLGRLLGLCLGRMVRLGTATDPWAPNVSQQNVRAAVKAARARLGCPVTEHLDCPLTGLER